MTGDAGARLRNNLFHQMENSGRCKDIKAPLFTAVSSMLLIQSQTARFLLASLFFHQVVCFPSSPVCFAWLCHVNANVCFGQNLGLLVEI